MDVDRAGVAVRVEYVDEDWDDEERDEGVGRICHWGPPPLQRGCKCHPVMEDERSNRGEWVGVEQDGQGRNGLGKERGGWMGTICL